MPKNTAVGSTGAASRNFPEEGRRVCWAVLEGGRRRLLGRKNPKKKKKKGDKKVFFPAGG